MVTSLLVRPHRTVLPILMPGGFLLTRLVIGVGVHVTQVVASLDRLTVHMDVYVDILVVKITVYPTLMVYVCPCEWMCVLCLLVFSCLVSPFFSSAGGN